MTREPSQLENLLKACRKFKFITYFHEVLKEKHSLFYKLFAGDTDDMIKI